ncbi:MAG TPA: DUF6476 family protein [Rhizomicrobium sp.]|nr:DUF6476 family protein [Rhizomicrobium sp.]
MTAGTAEDPKKTTTYRVLVVVVSILSVLILLAMAALIAGGIRQMRRHPETSPAVATVSLSAQLPEGSKITSVQTSGNRVVIAVHAPGGDEVDIFDTDTGRPVARIKAAAAAK